MLTYLKAAQTTMVHRKRLTAVDPALILVTDALANCQGLMIYICHQHAGLYMPVL